MAQNFARDYLKVHNKARRDVRVQKLNWNGFLEGYAEKVVSKEKSQCSTKNVVGVGKYGIKIEIIQRTSKFDPIGVDVVTSWVHQKKNYDKKSNSCIGNTINCRKYTQLQMLEVHKDQFSLLDQPPSRRNLQPNPPFFGQQNHTSETPCQALVW
ncbi:hypothetical protein PIB30_056597 [Stylosanthes scabra]|uniref:SCP domain-containing protein n=1 Tax=Stylosanthes scabra TaxID=79078 RepID=A0ABU6UMY3_9FABA|nr:hypothetical protein [Stylosanthes scabra]